MDATADKLTNRHVAIDIAKAICIVLVVIGHYNPEGAPLWYSTLHDVIYTFHMPLFMFASGYVYIATLKNASYGNFLLRKAKRLLVPYVVTSILVITIKLLTQGHAYVENPVTPMSYLRILWLPEAGFFLWFIWALWLAFMVLPFFKTKRSRLMLFAVALAMHLVPLDLTNVFGINQFKQMFVWFMAGVVVYEYAKSVVSSEYRWANLLAGVALFAICEVACFKFALSDSLSRAILAAVGIYFILELSKFVQRVCHVDSWHSMWMKLSAASYIIYLFHTTFEGLAKAVVNKLPLDHSVWYVFSTEALLVVACGVVLPLMLHRYILVRYKLTRILFGLS